MPPPSPSLFLLGSRVPVYPPGDNIQGRVLTSGAKQAFGFTEPGDADSVVRDLELEAEIAGATDPSFLILRLRGGGGQYSCIHAVDRNLILIAWAFLGLSPFELLLIYDVIDRSLRMIPTMPYPCTPPISTAYVLVARHHDDDRSYALVFPGRLFSRSRSGEHQRQDVLFVSPSSSTTPWQTTKKANFPSHLRSDVSLFDAHQVFSSGGRGYWVDLLRGGMYCDCSDVLSDDIDCVDVRSFDLPLGCMYLGSREEDIIEAELRAFRAMAPVGDSIKFVSIDGYLEHVDLEDCKVRVWRLMEEDMSWAVEHELKLASLWEFRGDLLPREMAPMYPFLSTQEDNVIYFALGTLIWGAQKCVLTKPCCMVRIDLHSETISCTGLSDSQRNCMSSLFVVSSNVW